MIKIKYVGFRPTHTDALYGTGAWTKGEVKSIPDEVVAARMLRHRDVYVKDDAASDTNATVANIQTKGKDDDEEARTQEIRDAVANMTKAALEQFAKTHFNVDLDKRQSVGDLRAKVTGLVDQYGIA